MNLSNSAAQNAILKPYQPSFCLDMCLSPSNSGALVNHAYRLIDHCLTNQVDHESFLSSTMQLIHKLLRCPTLLIKKKISHVKLYNLY